MPLRRLRRRVKKDKKEKKEKTAIMFPGQGTQELGMGRGVPPEILSDLFSQLREALGSSGDFTVSRLSLLVSPEACQAPQKEQEMMKKELNLIYNTQLAIFLVSCGEYLKIVNLQEKFRKPDFMLGHSVGEWTALWASGAIEFKLASQAIVSRGYLMHLAASNTVKRGGMVVVIGDIKIETVQKCLKNTDVQVANYNSPRQVVVSGGLSDLETVKMRLKTKGYIVIPINVSGAFHSDYMAGVPEELENAFNRMRLQITPPIVPVVFNYTGAPENDPKRIRKYLTEQVANTVRWVESIQFLFREGVAREGFKEVGPSRESKSNKEIKPSDILTRFLDDFPETAVKT